MSQGQSESGGEVSKRANRASRTLSVMMRNGRSFSGLERNCCFLNTGGAPAAAGRFADISAVSGLDFPDDGRAVALVDWDHDGDQDMWIANRNGPRLRLMRNDVPKGNHFLALRLEGNGKTTNRDAIGARVEVLLSNPKNEKQKPKSIKTLRAGEGFLAQSSKWIHFGLGAEREIEKVIVRWPGGKVEAFTGMDVDQRYRLIQGSGVARPTNLKTRETKLVRSDQEAIPASHVARIPMVDLLTVPRSPYIGLDGKQHKLQATKDRFTLVNLWAGWCPPCLVELKEFSDRHSELQSAGIDILALTIDGLGADNASEKMANAAKFVSKSKFPFTVGEATRRLVLDFQDLHNLQIPLQQGGQLPLPSSFLIDGEGRLAVIYKGPVSVDQILKDIAHSKGSRVERFIRSVPVAGQSIRHPMVERTAVVSAGFRRFLLGDYFQKAGRTDEAIRQYVDLLQFWPDSFWAHNNLGGAYQGLGRHAEAIQHFREALRIKPNEAMVHRNLGMALQGQGYAVEAMEHFHEALRLKPDDAKTHVKLGVALQKHGKTLEAMAQFRQALKINPDEATAHIMLAHALQGQKRMAEAIKHFEEALRINPEDVNTHNSLGVVLNIQGKFVDAADRFRKALKINPDDEKAHTNLGVAASGQGDFKAAIQHYTQALKLDPNFPLALNNLARIRATHPDAVLRDGGQALSLAARCCKLTNYRVVTAITTLAAAYAELNRFDEAIKWQAKAIEVAPGGRKSALVARLELYQSRMPYREKLDGD